MAHKYYKVLIGDHRVLLPNGGRISFQYITSREPGFLKTEDAYLINELDGLINRNIGGVVPSDEAEYEDFIKKKSATLLPPQSAQDPRGISAQQLPAPQRPSTRLQGGLAARLADAAVRAPDPKPAADPKPLQVPAAFPKLGKPKPA